MLRSQNFRYVYEYLREAQKRKIKEDNPAIILLRVIHNAILEMKYQPGFPRYVGEDAEIRSIFAHYSFQLAPGISEKTTWCNVATEKILSEMGYNTSLIMDQEFKSMGYTTIEEMLTGCLINSTIKEIDWKTAVSRANEGIPIFVIALGKGKNSSHVAIMAPTHKLIVKVTDCIVGQAGFYNGFGTLGDFFNSAYVQKPRFFELPKK